MTINFICDKLYVCVILIWLCRQSEISSWFISAYLFGMPHSIMFKVVPVKLSEDQVLN